MTERFRINPVKVVQLADEIGLELVGKEVQDMPSDQGVKIMDMIDAALVSMGGYGD